VNSHYKVLFLGVVLVCACLLVYHLCMLLLKSEMIVKQDYLIPHSVFGLNVANFCRFFACLINLHVSHFSVEHLYQLISGFCAVMHPGLCIRG